MDPAVARVIHPNWFPSPDAWVWTRPAGGRQGFGTNWRQEGQVGLSNLLWLVLDRQTPPALFEAASHPVYPLVLAHCRGALEVVTNLAEIGTLEEFHRLLSGLMRNHAKVPGVDLGPLLRKLAEKRIRHANA
jgi:hypothetical protein